MKTVTTSKSKTQAQAGGNGKNMIPRLENGDRLTRAEFERRYEAMPNVKAELVEGVVYMSSPVRVRKHGEPSARVLWWLGSYVVATRGVNFADNSTVRLDLDNEPQPDAVLYVNAECGGNSHVSADDYLEGSPELVVEIASSTASYDTTVKKNVYRRNEVREYIIWRVEDTAIDWFVLEDGEYVALEADQNGIIESRFFGGLRLNVKAILNDELQKVQEDLQQGLRSKKHRDFVKSLAK